MSLPVLEGMSSPYSLPSVTKQAWMSSPSVRANAWRARGYQRASEKPCGATRPGFTSQYNPSVEAGNACLIAQHDAAAVVEVVPSRSVPAAATLVTDAPGAPAASPPIANDSASTRRAARELPLRRLVVELVHGDRKRGRGFDDYEDEVLGAKAGDEVTFEAPSGPLKVEVIRIER